MRAFPTARLSLYGKVPCRSNHSKAPNGYLGERIGFHSVGGFILMTILGPACSGGPCTSQSGFLLFSPARRRCGCGEMIGDAVCASGRTPVQSAATVEPACLLGGHAPNAALSPAAHDARTRGAGAGGGVGLADAQGAHGCATVIGGFARSIAPIAKSRAPNAIFGAPDAIAAVDIPLAAARIQLAHPPIAIAAEEIAITPAHISIPVSLCPAGKVRFASGAHRIALGAHVYAVYAGASRFTSSDFPIKLHLIAHRPDASVASHNQR